MNEQPSEAPEELESPRLRAIELGQWPPIVEPVRLELDPRITVLIGRNGAGKTVIVEGIQKAALAAIGMLRPLSRAPGFFRCEFSRQGTASFLYEYHVQLLPIESGRSTAMSWSERSWRSSGAPIWTLAQGALTLPDGRKLPLPPGMSLLSVSHAGFPLPLEGEEIEGFFDDVMLISALRLRRRSRRGDVILSCRPDSDQFPEVSTDSDSIVGAFAGDLLWDYSHAREQFQEFVAVCRRIGIARDVKVQFYSPSSISSSGGRTERSELARILFDDIDVGLLSDGTLRAANIIYHLLTHVGGLLIIEEPEAFIHPGLLHRLLAEIEAYSIDRQIILTTHSPLVVDWAHPSSLRLVERQEEIISVSSLSEGQTARLQEYLNDEGTLGEFVYGGALDEPA